MAKLKPIPRAWPPRFWKIGFDGRPFLTESEWRTYLRRPPVRRGYIQFRKIRGNAPKKKCAACGKRETQQNPLQAAHRINALNGVRYLALTPDFLDEPDRLVWAHRKQCNSRVEMNFEDTMSYLWREGIRKLPAFLPLPVFSVWENFRNRSRVALP
jgi:hypothetical protein